MAAVPTAPNRKTFSATGRSEHEPLTGTPVAEPGRWGPEALLAYALPVRNCATPSALCSTRPWFSSLRDRPTSLPRAHWPRLRHSACQQFTARPCPAHRLRPAPPLTHARTHRCSARTGVLRLATWNPSVHRREYKLHLGLPDYTPVCMRFSVLSKSFIVLNLICSYKMESFVPIRFQ